MSINLCDSDDEIEQILPNIEDDEDDDLISNTILDFDLPDLTDKKESLGMKEINVRRSGRARKAATYTGMVSTAENVSMKDIPLNDYVSHTSKATYKFSMPVLLKEKKSREKTGYDIQILEQTLIDDEPLGDIEDPFGEYDREALTAKVLPEQNDHLRKIFQEDEQIEFDRQLNFFESPQIFPVPALRGTGNKFINFLRDISSDPNSLKDMLCTGWIPQQYEMGTEISTEIIHWLLDIVSFVENKYISEAAFENLKQLAWINSRHGTTSESSNGPHGILFSRIVEILSIYGAPQNVLSYQCVLEEKSTIISLKEASQLLQLPFNPSISSPEEISPQMLQLPQLPITFNLNLLLGILSNMTKSRTLKFQDNDEVRLAISLLLRMSLDRRLWSISTIIEDVIGDLLMLFDECNWCIQAKLICEDTALSCGTVSQFKVRLLESFPITKRGRFLRKLLAFRFLFGGSSLSWNMTELDLSKPIMLAPLLELFKDDAPAFKIHNETNYNELCHSVEILGIALDDDIELRAEKAIAEELIKKLKHLHGKIVDMRAAFLDRTKAKDFIQRLFMRIYFIINYRTSGQRQTSILLYSPKKSQKTLDFFADSNGWEIGQDNTKSSKN